MEGGARDTELITVDNLFENPARFRHASMSIAQLGHF